MSDFSKKSDAGFEQFQITEEPFQKKKRYKNPRK